jgi:putative aminopeptidase FrvX
VTTSATTPPQLLLDLITAAGPPGAESVPVQVFREAAAAFGAEVTTDTLGSPIARVPGRGEQPLVAIVGHIDEIALLVSHVTEKGYLKLISAGGWDPQILVGQRVEVLTTQGSVPGVVGRKPIHVLEGKERETAVKLKDLHVDIGAADDDEARALVRVGDPLVIIAEPIALPNGRLVSRSLDNRIGSYVALEVARRVAEAGGGAGPVAGVAAVQEEIGSIGAAAVAHELRPAAAIAVDVTHASDAPGVDAAQVGDHGLGSGASISRGPFINQRLVDLLIEIAEAEDIPYTLEAEGRSTYTDADSFHRSRGGVPTALVAIPIRYMHSPVELVQLDDIEAVVALLTAFALRIDAQTDLTRW